MAPALGFPPAKSGHPCCTVFLVHAIRLYGRETLWLPVNVAQWRRDGVGAGKSIDAARATHNVSVDVINDPLRHRQRHHRRGQPQQPEARYYYTSTLSLSSSVTKDAGAYVCSATNSHGFVERRTFLRVTPSGEYSMCGRNGNAGEPCENLFLGLSTGDASAVARGHHPGNILRFYTQNPAMECIIGPENGSQCRP